MTLGAVIAAGGKGERFGRPGGKQLAPLAGTTVVSHTVGVFDTLPGIDTIVVVADPDALEVFGDELEAFSRVRAIVPGGATRQESVEAGVAALGADVDVVVIHDGARPLVTAPTVLSAIEALDETIDGVAVGHPAYDTVKSVDADRLVIGTEDRSRLWLAQTPQVFWRVVLHRAYAWAERTGFIGTDDASLVEHMGGRVRVVMGPRDNIKITVAQDLAFAEAVLKARRGSS
ncbi:MAG: 2-C-methyl-D-erythritol 4-phosphate cytidylyltransferase [Coriobacteriales bacterium]